MRILIADDDAMSCRLLESTLVKLGHDVVSVADGTQAIANLLQDDGPRLAILDWMMPGADGPAVCRAIRNRPGLYTYIILLTARNNPEDIVAGLEAGADDFLSKPFNAGELRARLRSGIRVVDLQTTLLETQHALRIQATHDDLTGLWNRRTIVEQMAIELNRTKRESQSLVVALADIDLFKRVNDNHGHAVGDAVLRTTAGQLRLQLRNYDYIGRYGGEEFLILLSNCDKAKGIAILQRSSAAIAATPVRVQGVELAITVSIGVSSTAEDGFGSEALIAAADAALYRAKERGRNRVE